MSYARFLSNTFHDQYRRRQVVDKWSLCKKRPQGFHIFCMKNSGVREFITWRFRRVTCDVTLLSLWDDESMFVKFADCKRLGLKWIYHVIQFQKKMEDKENLRLFGFIMEGILLVSRIHVAKKIWIFVANFINVNYYNSFTV